MITTWHIEKSSLKIRILTIFVEMQIFAVIKIDKCNKEKVSLVNQFY